MVFSLNFRFQKLISFNTPTVNRNHQTGFVLDVRDKKEYDTVFILQDFMLYWGRQKMQIKHVVGGSFLRRNYQCTGDSDLWKKTKIRGTGCR